MLTTIAVIFILILSSCKDSKDENVKTSFFIGVSPNMDGDLSPFMSEKLLDVSGKDVVINFEKGDYHFYPENATAAYLTISNNDNGNKKIAIPIFGANSFKLQGNGSNLIFHGGIIPFVLKNVNEASMSNFNVYWDKPFTFEGEVIENSQESKSFSLKVNKDNDFEIRNGRLFFKGYDWELPLGENIVYDKSTRRPYYLTSDYEHQWNKNELRAEQVSPGIVQFSNLNSDQVPPIGSIWVDKGPHSQNRKFPAIFINDSKDIEIASVNIYASGAMALIAEKSENIMLKKFNITLPQNSDRMIGVSADATHFVNCKGLIQMDSCLFENMLDDATNVQGTYMLVDEIIDSQTFKSHFGHFQQEGFPFASIGDSIRFISRNDLLPIQVATVKSIFMESENDYTISINEELNATNLSNSVVENISDEASVIITNSIIRQNRARSLLISTSKQVQISNNYFSSMMAGIRICGDANFWFESGPVADVMINNNVFEDLGVGGHNPQAILQIDPIIGSEYRENGFYHKNITFKNNTIRTFDRLIIYALSVDGLTITGNILEQTTGYREIYPHLSHFDLQNCRNVFISNNSFKGNGLAEISLKNCLEVEIEKQIGFRQNTVNNPNKYFYQN